MNNCMNNCNNAINDSFNCERTFLPETMTVTMAYVPFQLDLSHFNVDDAFCRGTLFCDLDKPFKGRCTR